MNEGEQCGAILTFYIQRGSDAWEAIEPELEPLYASLSAPNPYFSPEWLRHWRKWFARDAEPLTFLVRDAQGTLRACWPFVEKSGVLGAKGLWPFVFDEADYHHPLAHEDAIPALLDGVRLLLRDGGYHYLWTSLLPDAFHSKHLAPFFADKSDLLLERSPRLTTFVDFRPFATFDAYLRDRLGSKSRKTLRYEERALARAGKITHEIHADTSSLGAFLPSSCIVENNSWKTPQVAGIYSIRNKRAFFFDLLPDLARKGRVTASCLRVNDEPIAWELGLLASGTEPDSTTYHLHNIAYDEAWKKHSPGRQLLLLNLAQAHADGRRIDLLPGGLGYKRRLATHDEPVHELHWFRNSARAALTRFLIKVNRRLRKRLRSSAAQGNESRFLRAERDGL